MKLEGQKNVAGFTLIELMISFALSMIILASTVQLFKSGVEASTLISQRAELQQNSRAAINLISKDVSMAGAGIPPGGIQLASGGTATASKYGCDQAGTCYVMTHLYPTGNYFYGIIPGPNNGVQGGGLIPSTGASADSITVAYVDYGFPLFQYGCRVTNATTITLTAPVPAPVPPLPAPNAPGVGLQLGDLVMISTNVGTVITEATTATATTVTLGSPDSLNINELGGAIGNLGYINGTNPGNVTCAAYRVYVVTYYIQVPVNGQSPRLMRQVNGLTPVAVADGIIGLTISYDLFNDTTGLNNAEQRDPLSIAGVTPNQIRKVNISVSAQSIGQDGAKSQSMQVATSISARNMSFRNRYQ